MKFKLKNTNRQTRRLIRQMRNNQIFRTSNKRRKRSWQRILTVTSSISILIINSFNSFSASWRIIYGKKVEQYLMEALKLCSHFCILIWDCQSTRICNPSPLRWHRLKIIVYSIQASQRNWHHYFPPKFLSLSLSLRTSLYNLSLYWIKIVFSSWFINVSLKPHLSSRLFSPRSLGMKVLFVDFKRQWRNVWRFLCSSI